MLEDEEWIQGIIKAIVLDEPDREEMTEERMDKILAAMEREGLVAKKIDNEGTERVILTPRGQRIGDTVFARLNRSACTH